jgi:hypothetical protein
MVENEMEHYAAFRSGIRSSKAAKEILRRNADEKYRASNQSREFTEKRKR